MQIDKIIVWIISAMFLGVMLLITLLNWKIDNIEKRVLFMEGRETLRVETMRREGNKCYL